MSLLAQERFDFGSTTLVNDLKVVENRLFVLVENTLDNRQSLFYFDEDGSEQIYKNEGMTVFPEDIFHVGNDLL